MSAPDKEDGLPPPVQAPASAMSTSRTRFAAPATSNVQRFRVHWARLRKRIGTGSADAPSESAYDDTLDGSGTWRRASDNRSSHVGAGTGGAWNNVGGQENEPQEVDEIVVNNSYAGLGYGAPDEENESHTGRTTSEKHPDAGTSSHNHPTTDKESTTTLSVWDRWVILSIIRWRIIPGFARFHSLSFADPNSEAQYSRESWYSNKALAILTGCWLILNWVITCAVATNLTVPDKAFYYGLSAFLNIPVPIMIIFDWPRKRPILYQSWLTVTLWTWAFYNLLTLRLCGYYPPMHRFFTCGAKDFQGMFYFAAAFPTVGLFALQQRRVPALFGGLSFFIIAGSLVLPYRRSFVRNLLNVLIFHVILLYAHFMREHAERRLYTLRDQVKLQYKATQKAQVSERKASDSKRRLTSYIFHEVRVPLNTAMLALQNLEATFPDSQRDSDQAIELGALNASLSMMSKDNNRMDAGRFESVSKPFAFHKVIRSSMVGLQLLANSKGLELVTDFDRNIDLVARSMMFRAQGQTEEWIAWHLACGPPEDAEVLGDEMRLTQVVTNLTSNAYKFTPGGPGGRITVRTKLLYPEPGSQTATTVTASGPSSEATVINGRLAPNRRQPHHSLTESTDATAVELESSRDLEQDGGLSVSRLKGHDEAMEAEAQKKVLEEEAREDAGQRTKQRARKTIVVRIEVHDTGVGIKPRDMIDNRLFSPYVQTEIGRHQGGKGTGLGLALVRHIVKLSGGRLGVQSRPEGGSCFWVEFPFGIPTQATDHTMPMPTPFPQRDPFSYLGNDATTPFTDATQSSGFTNAPNFLDLKGPTVPAEMMDTIVDELPDSALPTPVKLGDGSGSPTPRSGSATIQDGRTGPLLPMPAPATSTIPSPPFTVNIPLQPLGRSSQSQFHPPISPVPSNDSRQSHSRSASESPSHLRSASISNVNNATSISMPISIPIAMPVPSLAQNNYDPNTTQNPLEVITSPTPPIIPALTSAAVAGIGMGSGGSGSLALPSGMNPLMKTESRGSMAGSQVSPRDPSPSLSARSGPRARPPVLGSLPHNPLSSVNVTASTNGGSSGPAARPNLIRLPTATDSSTISAIAAINSGSTSGAVKTPASTPSSFGAVTNYNPRSNPSNASPSSVGQGSEIGSVRALVVDDDPLTRRLMERMLQRIGCVVDTAENGQMALDMILGDAKDENAAHPSKTESNYDVVFLDNQMPIMSGVAMVKKLREEGRTEFTVGITGNALKEDQVEYMEAGLDRVLTKPVLERSLREMLRYALDRRKPSLAHTGDSASGSPSGSPGEEKTPSA
ncbi:hypothetical protein DL93DRAFT_2171193 [Clavulina sp. PMI_390]|nr:hypothetical protein DL93DRAFT_2171193 [Clavulina sp. PMI_390]